MSCQKSAIKSKLPTPDSELQTPNSKLFLISNERGIALVIVMILSTIALAVMAGLIYMVTTGTQISGMQKRYKTALEAAKGGNDIASQVINLKGDTSQITGLIGLLTGSITTPSSCVTLSSDASCTAIGSYTGINAKLNLPTSCWSGCDSSMTINTATSSTYDMTFTLGTSPVYTVYAKIVDTVYGNTSSSTEDLGSGKGVVDTGTEISGVYVPFLYTLEIDAQNASNPAERAKLSILYQY